VLKVALNKVKADIESGKRLGDCLEPHSNVFDNLYVNLVKAGEEGGVLDTILNRLASYIEKSVKIRNKVQGALFYPAAILFVAAIVIFAIMTFVIPKFKELFTGSGQKLPALTQFVVNMSEFFVSYWYLIIGGTVGLALFVKQWFGTKEGQQTFDTYIIGVPIFGTLIQKASIARFTRTLSTMLSSGVSIIDALDISAKVCGNYLIEKSLMGAKKLIPKTLSKLVVAKASNVKGYDFKVPGKHQLENLACAVEVANQFKISISNIKKVVKNFKGVEGRLEYMKTVKGVKIYNDNNATTPEATIAGLEALGSKRNIVLICGGADKGLETKIFAKAIDKYCKAVVLLSGTGTYKLLKNKIKTNKMIVANLKDAIKYSLQNVKKGDTILFSPAFASFGMFTNEYDRNDQFVKIIKKIK
jgi:hypothetical protein